MQEADVIVLNWRDEARTLACVESVQAQSGVRHIYVVDNEATGALAHTLSGIEAQLTVLESPENRGFAGGVNIAFRAREKAGADGPVLILNNDAQLAPGALSAMLEVLVRSPRVGAVGPVLLNPDGTLQAAGHRISRLTGISRASQHPAQRVDYITWACVLLANSAISQVGILDERFFMYWEDVDYGLRLEAAGLTSIVTPRATVIHELSASKDQVGPLLREYYMWSLRQFAQKRLGMDRTRAYVAMLMVFLARLARADWSGTRALVRGMRRPRVTMAWKSMASTLGGRG